MSNAKKALEHVKIVTADQLAESAKTVTSGTLSIADRILSVSRAQIGNAEEPKGSNWGKHVQKYLASVGINFAAAWCMAFVYWCVNEACKENGSQNPLAKTGGVLDQWNKSKLLRVTKPERGDIFIMDYGKGLGHTGIVSKVNADGTIDTIEGNTNDEGSREGYEVARRKRTISKCKGFIRIS